MIKKIIPAIVLYVGLVTNSFSQENPELFGKVKSGVQTTPKTIGIGGSIEGGMKTKNKEIYFGGTPISSGNIDIIINAGATYFPEIFIEKNKKLGLGINWSNTRTFEELSSPIVIKTENKTIYGISNTISAITPYLKSEINIKPLNLEFLVGIPIVFEDEQNYTPNLEKTKSYSPILKVEISYNIFDFLNKKTNPN